MASWTAPGQGLGARVLRALVYLLMVLAVWYLICGDKPWIYSEEVAALKEEGKKLQLHHHVAAGLFYASVINLFLGGIVLLLRPWWARRLLGPDVEPEREQERGSGGRLPGRVFWIGAVLAVLLAGALRVNLAKGSLWWDELWNIKHTMSGEFRPDMKKGGVLKFREVPWEKTLYYYRKPTNHPPMAIASRFSLGAWREASGAERSEFNEVAARLPSLLAGLVSVLGVAVLLRSWGFGGGGLVAAFLLALHPWHLRYGVDARAYSFAVLWSVLACLWLGKLMRAGGDGWRYWILFGLNQLMLVWSLPNGIYYAFVFGLVGLVFCLRQAPSRRLLLFTRLVAVNLVAAMVFMFLFLPNALQIGEWGEVNDHHYLSGIVLKNVATQLAFGLEIGWGTSIESEGLRSFTTELAAQPLSGWLAMLSGGVAFLAGVLTLVRSLPRRSWIFVALAVGAGLSLLVTWKLQQHFYQRYVVAYLIVPVLALVGIGAFELAKVVPQRVRPGWLAPLLALLVVGSFAAFTQGQREILNTRSYAPFREVAEFVSREAELGPVDVIGYGLGGRVFQIYFPEGKFADTLEELDERLAEAKGRARTVYVVFGYAQFNSADAGPATGAAKVQDGSLFEEVAAFGGIDPMFYFRVMRGKEG